MIALLLVWSAALPAPDAKGGLVLASGEVAVFGSRQRNGGTALVMSATADEGRSWREVGTVAFDPLPHVDLGDGNAVRLRDGRLWAVFRRNHHGDSPDYAIEVAESRDGGKTWRRQGSVETSKPHGAGPSRGLWAPFLLVTKRGEIQCYYDDEALPFARGAKGHQWIAMRAWRTGRWRGPTIVAREPAGLSRDGMASVVDLGPGGLLCAVEAVRASEPHAGLLRLFRSTDGGRTWGAPGPLYAPKDDRFHAFSPSLAQVGDRLVCVFSTNEDRTDSPRSGTPAERMGLDIKAIESADGGRTWSAPSLVYAGTNRNYLPSVVAVGKRRMIATFLDFAAGPRCVVGKIRTADPSSAVE